MKRATHPQQPLPEKEYKLYYRGKEVASGTLTHCTGEKLRMIASGSWLRMYFALTPVNPKPATT